MYPVCFSATSRLPRSFAGNSSFCRITACLRMWHFRYWPFWPLANAAKTHSDSLANICQRSPLLRGRTPVRHVTSLGKWVHSYSSQVSKAPASTRCPATVEAPAQQLAASLSTRDHLRCSLWLLPDTVEVEERSAHKLCEGNLLRSLAHRPHKLFAKRKGAEAKHRRSRGDEKRQLQALCALA